MYRRLGFVLTATDVTGPAEIPKVLLGVPNVTWQTTQLRFPDGNDSLGLESYGHAADNLQDSASLLRPVGSYDAIGVACTSFSFTVGSDRIARELGAVHGPQTPIINMDRAIFDACSALGIKNPCVLTPCAALTP